MAQYVARGIFDGLPQATLDAKRVIALARIDSGDFKSLAGAGKSSSREWPLSPDQILLEIQHAEQVASGIPRANRIYTDLRTQPLGRRV